MKKRTDGWEKMANKMVMYPPSLSENMWETFVLFWELEEGRVRVSQDTSCVMSLSF